MSTSRSKRPSLDTVHQCQQLRHDTTLDFAIGLVSLGSDRVNLVDKDDGRAVFLGLFECFTQVGLGFTSHFRHDFGSVDEEKEGAGLVGDSTSHERFTGTGRAKHQDTARRLDSDGFEQLRVTKGELDKFADLHQLHLGFDVPVRAACGIHRDHRIQPD